MLTFMKSVEAPVGGVVLEHESSARGGGRFIDELQSTVEEAYIFC